MTNQLNVRLPIYTEEQIEKLIDNTGMTQTQLIILAIDRYYRERIENMEAQTAIIDILDVGLLTMGRFPPALQTLAGTDTIALSSNQGVARLTASAARTGGIIPAGTKTGQRLLLFMEGASANTLTMAAAGTSNVAGGATVVLTGLAAHEFIWNNVTALWYQIGPVSQ